MADKPDDGPSLEMPSFSMRRRKGRTTEPEESSDTTAAPQEAPREPEPEPISRATLQPDPEPTPAPTAVTEPVTEPVPVAASAPTRVIETPPVPERRSRPDPTLPEPGREQAPEAEADPERETRAPRVTLPALPGLTAAAVTGAVVGALALLLTWLATASCDAVRGTSSCGGGPGFLILVAVLVMLAYAGALLLGAFGVPDAGSTSVLAVGITAVLVMLFLLDAIYDGWMVIAIPVVSVVAYVGSWWITHAVVESN